MIIIKTQPSRKPHKVASIAYVNVNKFLKIAHQLFTHVITQDNELTRNCSL